jgi:hypothetical protein
MNNFRTPSKLTRAVAAAAAVFSTVLVVSAMVGLAGFYNDNAVMAAGTTTSTVASR